MHGSRVSECNTGTHLEKLMLLHLFQGTPGVTVGEAVDQHLKGRQAAALEDSQPPEAICARLRRHAHTG